MTMYCYRTRTVASFVALLVSKVPLNCSVSAVADFKRLPPFCGIDAPDMSERSIIQWFFVMHVLTEKVTNSLFRKTLRISWPSLYNFLIFLFPWNRWLHWPPSSVCYTKSYQPPLFVQLCWLACLRPWIFNRVPESVLIKFSQFTLLCVVQY